MFQRLPTYPDVVPSRFWEASVPAHWNAAPGMAVLTENKRKNADLDEDRVLSLSYGRIIVKPVEKQRGLVPDSYEGYQVLDPGDIVIRPTDLQNDQTSIRVGMVRDRGIITSAYIGVRPKGSWSADYAYAYLATVDSSKRIYGMGSGLRQQLGWSDLKRMPCLVPPANEQAAVVKYLAHANARIDKAISAKRRLIALLDEELGASTAELMRHELGRTVRTKDVCLRIVDCKNRTPEFVEGGEFHVVRTTCVRAGEFSMQGSYTTDEANFRVWTERGAPKPGDVFFTREAPAGEAALVPDRKDLCLGQRMMYFRPDPRLVLSEYLLLAIYALPARQFIDVATNGSTVGHLRLGDVGAIPLTLPSLEAQHQVVLRNQTQSAPVRRAKDRIVSEIALLREFRTRLVADVVTGQVDVRAVAAALPDVGQHAAWGESGDADALEPADFNDVLEASEV